MIEFMAPKSKTESVTIIVPTVSLSEATAYLNFWLHDAKGLLKELHEQNVDLERRFHHRWGDTRPANPSAHDILLHRIGELELRDKLNTYRDAIKFIYEQA